MSYARLVKPGSKFKLNDVDPGYHDGLSEEEALTRLGEIGNKISKLQELLYAAKQNSMLIVLQGRDTSGKDGAIRRILHYCNVQSTSVVPFKVPTSVEAGHDFLWRVHSHAPGKGDVTIFNRSHYEDVLVARVHKLVPKKVWKRRYDHINNFERLLTESGVIVLKFYLHISKGEQEQRLLAREQDPEKSWKLSVGDWKERELWDDYTDAYEDALDECSTNDAPWRVVPANHKWFRDLAIAQTLLHELEPYEKTWKASLQQLGVEQKAEIDAFRKAK
ncbi:MAG TPA: PPK2 family polyphosphate kinase [Fimbriimonas sp.]|nr:PPK2 family polyphosphate kinase [Fimbriimonas sp.]